MGRAAPERRLLFDLAIMERDSLALTSGRALFAFHASIRSLLAYSSLAKALREIPIQRPGVVLIDLWVGKSNAIDLVRRLTTQCPETRVLIYSDCHDPQMIQEAVMAGACGYLLKPASRAELIQAVEAVASGEIYFSKPGLEALITALQAPSQSWRGLPISPQQLRIARFYLQNFSYQEIGDKLHITAGTVHTQLHKFRIRI